MAQFWPTVPQVRWPGSKGDVSEESDSAGPSVKANVAATRNESQELPEAGRIRFSEEDVSTTSGEVNRSTSAIADVSPQRGQDNAEPLVSEEGSLLAARKPTDSNSSDSSQGDRAEDQIERLKAALNDDARRVAEPNRLAGGASDVRVRVESLLERARRAFAVGQLTEARRAAQLAQDLGETGRLDYSPDEERPVDLVNRIDDQMQDTVDASAETSSEMTDVANEGRSLPEATSEGSAKVAQREESTNRTWLRGYGTGVFRRERKGTAAESSAPDMTVVTPSPTDSTVLDAVIETPGDQHSAVVQANRSVTLPKSTFIQGAATNDDRSQNGVGRVTERVAFSAETTNRVDSFELIGHDLDRLSHGEDSFDDPLVMTLGNETEDAPKLVADVSVAAPPLFEEVKPVSPFRSVERKVRANRSPSGTLDELPAATWGWLAGAALFAVCGALAITCYRRGAT